MNDEEFDSRLKRGRQALEDWAKVRNNMTEQPPTNEDAFDFLIEKPATLPLPAPLKPLRAGATAWKSVPKVQPAAPTPTRGAPGRPLRYRSALKRAILLGLIQKPHSSDRTLCDWLDEQGCDLPPGLTRTKDRTFASAYLDPDRKPNIESMISKVRKDIRKAGIRQD